MQWRWVCAAGLGVALVSTASFQAPAGAADAGPSSAAETRVDVKWDRASRAHAPRRTVVYVTPRYRAVRPRIIWQVDASSVQPAYVLR